MLEEEWKFEIRALKPEAEVLMGRLRREERLGKFSLGPSQQKYIEDSFFDTITRDLWGKRCMLRLRVEDATVVKLALKSPFPAETEDDGGPTRRYEFEAEPSIDLLEQIRSELTDLGIADLEISSVDFRKAGPVGVLLSWGFQEVLTARNRRCKRSVYVEGQQVATLVLDDVTFSTPEKQYKIREIEVERWEDAPLSLCAEFVSLLEQRSAPGLLFPVSESKYGRAQDLISREADFNCEMKLIRTDLSLSVEEVERRFLEMDRIAGYTLENPPLTSFLSDVYYDTGELKLLKLDHYLRVRNVVTQGRNKSGPASQELTLRRYVFTQADELRGSDQIKGPLSSENLVEVLRVLKSLGVIQLSDADILDAEASEHTLLRAGLQQVLGVEIERRVWPVFNSAERHFANIKLDKVRFQSPQYKSVSHWELEIGALDTSELDRVRAMAYALMAELGLRPYNSPKYKTGHNLVRDLALSTNGALRFVVRTPTWADQWTAQEVVRQIAGQKSVQQTLEGMPPRERKELLERGTEGLKTTVEKTLDKLSSMRQMQMVMAGALFFLGLTIIGGSAYLAAVGTMSLEQSVVGTGVGVILDVLVLFPFRQMSSLSEQYSRLATLGDMVQILLGMEGMSPELRESVETLIQDALGGATLKARGPGQEIGEEKDEKHSQR